MRRHTESKRGRDLHLVEQAVAERLLVEGHVVAAPHRSKEQVRLRGEDLGDVRGKVGGAELGPVFRHGLAAGQEPLGGKREMLRSVATVAVVRMNVRNLARMRPCLAAPIAAVMPSADWMLVMRNTYFGFGSATSNRKSVHPSVNIVSRPSSSATGPSAGLFPLEMTPVKRSMLPSSFMRRSSLTLASVPAASSAVMVSILRLPNRPPCALISSAARMWPL